MSEIPTVEPKNDLANDIFAQTEEDLPDENPVSAKMALKSAKERYDTLWKEGPALEAAGKVFVGTGLKFDTGKPRVDLIAPEFLLEIGKVLAYGVNKYDKVNKAYNWRYGMAWSRPLAAALRHIMMWTTGERYDKESGLSHLAHAATNLMFLTSYEINSVGQDDRWHEPAKNKPLEVG